MLCKQTKKACVLYWIQLKFKFILTGLQYAWFYYLKMASIFKIHSRSLKLAVLLLNKQFSTRPKKFVNRHQFKNAFNAQKKQANKFTTPYHFKDALNSEQNVTRRKHPPFPLYEIPKVNLAPKLDKRPKQKFDYFLVLDFEATCDSPVNLDPQEIIEFPVLKVNSNTFEIESKFHSYVQPLLFPELTPFCTELTGVIQSMVENQPPFKEVFEKFQSWLLSENILKPDVKFAFATCGDPDLDYLLPLQCRVSEIEVPDYMKEWINVKRSFCEISPYTWPDNLVHMLKMCELQHSGELHSGIDDALNVVKVMADLADRGLVFSFNGWIKQ